MKRLLVRYLGMVQGVGFRATARRLAGDYRLSGWVKNRADGSVEMVVSGAEAEIESFLKAIRDSRLGALIEREEIEPQAAIGLEKGFEIR